MTAFCGQVSIPTVNNDAIACANYFDTDCVIYQNPIAYFGTIDPSTSTEVFDLIITSLIDARTRIATVEGTILPTTHADLLGLAADDHSQYLTEDRGRALLLTGLNVGLTGDVVATDTLLEGVGKLQNQVDGLSGDFVDLTTAQDVDGAKTFQSSVRINAFEGAAANNFSTLDQALGQINGSYGPSVGFGATLWQLDGKYIWAANHSIGTQFNVKWDFIGNTGIREYTLPDQTGTMALEENVVTLTTAQTISGVKTISSQTQFTGRPQIKGSIPAIDFDAFTNYASTSNSAHHIWFDTSGNFGIKKNGDTNVSSMRFGNANTGHRLHTFQDEDGTVAHLTDIIGVAEVYAATWDGKTEPATKNDIYDKIEALSLAAGMGGVIADNQVAFGSGTDIAGSADFIWDDVNLTFRGSGVSRYIRFAESPGFYNGAYMEYEGATNKFHMGVHAASDALEASDTKVITMQRADGFIGINKEIPVYELDVVGTIQASVDFRSPGVRIAPTFADFEGRIATGGVSGFGGARLGDSDMQAATYDVGTSINWKEAAQVTQWSMFSNVSGNTMTMRHVENPTALLSIQNNAADVVLGVNDVESTLGLVTQYSTGDPHVYDLFNQNYIADGSVIAIAQGVNMIAPVADHRPYVIARSEPGLTNITTMLEIDGGTLSTQIATWGIPVVVPEEVYDATAWNGSLEVPTKNAVRDKIEALGFVDLTTAQSIAGLKTFSDISIFNGSQTTVAGTLQLSSTSAAVNLRNSTFVETVFTANYAHMWADASSNFSWNKASGETNSFGYTFITENATVHRDYTFQDKDGTVALKPTVIDIAASRNIASSDIGEIVACTTSSTLTITLTFSAMAIGDTIQLEAHATTLTVTGATGVTVNGTSAGSATVGDNAGYLHGYIRKTGTDTYMVFTG